MNCQFLHDLVLCAFAAQVAYLTYLVGYAKGFKDGYRKGKRSK